MSNKVTINKSTGGLGRPLTGEDHITGYVHYTTALPSGFSATDRIKQIFSITDAENLGITDNHSGETRAISILGVTATGATSNTLQVNVVTQYGTTNLGTYTQVSGDSTTTLVATALATVINSFSGTHGYSCTAATSNVSITAPAGTGIGAHSYTYANLFTGTISATTGSYAGGVASQIDVLHYELDEYFRIQPKGNLYLGIYSATTDYSEITTVQNFAVGKIKQIGVFTQTNFATSMVSALQTAANTCELNYKPLEVLLQANFSQVTDLTTLTDLHTLSSKSVSVCFGQDGGAQGLSLWYAHGKSSGSLGTTLGAVALSKVSESIAWPAKYQMGAVEFETLSFANGAKLTAQSDGLIDAIDDKGYVFLRNHIGLGGSYVNNPYTCTLVTSDYCRIPNNRTINKAVRGLRTFLLPQLASPITVNSDGTLSEDVITFFETLCQNSLEQMIRNQELSAYAIVIDPTQNVLSTSQLIINVSLVPIGTSDNIIVNLGFVVSV